MPRPAALSLPRVPHVSGASDIELGILTVIFGGKELGDARPAFVLRGCMTMLLHEGPRHLPS